MDNRKNISDLERKKWDLLKKRAAVFDSLFDLGDRKTLSTRIEKELDDIELEIIALKNPEMDALMAETKRIKGL